MDKATVMATVMAMDTDTVMATATETKRKSIGFHESISKNNNY